MAAKGEAYLGKWARSFTCHIFYVSTILCLACGLSSGTQIDKSERLCLLYECLIREVHDDLKDLAVARLSIGDPLLMSYIDAVRARSERAWETLPSEVEPIGDDPSIEELDRFFHQEFLRNVRDNFEVYEKDHARWVARLMNLTPGLERSTIDDFVDSNTSTLSADLEDCSHLRDGVTLLPADYSEKIYINNSDDPIWEDIYLRYPSVERVALLSAAGCSDSAQQCLIYSLTVRLKVDQAKGVYYLLVRNGEEWRVNYRLPVWDQ